MAPLTLDDIRKRTSNTSYSRGQSYFRSQSIINAAQEGNILLAECRGSRSSPYRVRAELDGNGRILHTSCSCPYEFGDDCKHIVALLVTYVNAPAQFKTQQPLAETLKNLSQDDLISVIVKLIEKHPGERKVIDRLTATKPKTSKGQSLDVEAMRKTFQELLAEFIDLDEYGDYDYYDEEREYGDDIDYDNLPEGEDALKLLKDFIEQAKAAATQKQWSVVSAVGRMILEEVPNYPSAMEAMDFEGELATVIGEVAILLSKALGALQTDTKERGLIQDALIQLELSNLDLPDGVEFGLEILPTVLKSAQGDDIQRIRKLIANVLDNEEKHQAHWYANYHHYCEELLIQIDQFEGVDLNKTIEWLRERKAHEVLFRLLLEHKRVPEASQIIERETRNHLNLAVRFLDTLEAQYAAEALQTAERMFKAGYDSRLATWLVERRRKQGDREGEFQLRLEMMKHQPTLREYQGLRHIAQQMGNWDTLRSDALETLMAAGAYQVVIQACIDDEDWGQAWVMLRRIQQAQKPQLAYSIKAWEQDLAGRTLHFTPDEAIPVIMRTVYELIEVKNRGAYQTAVHHLKKLHEFYQKDTNEVVFKKIVEQIRGEFPTLRALQEELKLAGF
jgi:uncharacterized Zn finger protein